MPVLVDPNTGVTAWESGAIINYLRRQYDVSDDNSSDRSVLGPHGSGPDGKITAQDRVDLDKWECLLMTTTGPMSGQVAWFRHYHQPPNPDALKRYEAQVFRCYDVLEAQLRKSGGGSILPGGVSSADVHSYPWIRQPAFLGLPHDGYPMIAAWVQSLSERLEFKRAYDRLQEAATAVGQANAGEKGEVLGADPGLLKAIGEGTV